MYGIRTKIVSGPYSVIFCTLEYAYTQFNVCAVFGLFIYFFFHRLWKLYYPRTMKKKIVRTLVWGDTFSASTRRAIYIQNRCLFLDVQDFLVQK